MLVETSSVELSGRLGLSLCMAVFLGLSFEGVYKLEQRGRPGGIRSFPLLTTVGAALFLLQPDTLLPFGIGLAAVALWQYAHLRGDAGEGERHTSLVIPAAGLLAYTLGPLALTQPAWLVVAAAVTAVLLIEGREPLHRLVHAVAPAEIFTLGKFLILIGVILPLVPRRPVVSFSPITPFQVWLALVATSTLSYASYLLQTYLPRRSTALLPAILGGLYSSTVTTVALARQQRAAAVARREFSVGIVVATAIMYLRIGVIVSLFDWTLARTLLPALLILAAIGALIAVLDWSHLAQSATVTAAQVPAANPLQLGTALTFAALFVAVALLTTWVRAGFGERGVFAVAAITGATDIDPFVLSLVQGSVGGMSAGALGAAILIASSSNNALKAAYAIGFGGRACRRPALELMAMAGCGVVAAGFCLYHP
jgi:uncharacterized membrane protein (DUF4010 family)